MPAYGRASIAEVLPSAAAALGVRGYDDVLGLGEADRVVVLLCDGLGHHQLAASAAAPFLAGMDARVLTSAFPSTTPTGLASLGTGLPPGRHGLVGAAFRLPGTGRVLWPLGWRDDPGPVATQPEPTVLEQAAAAGVAVTRVAPRAFEASGLTRAALRGGAWTGADGFGETVAGAAEAVRRGRRSLVYAYAGSLDRAGHVHGAASSAWAAELAHLDLLVSQLVRALPGGALLLVTADHGMVDAGRRIDLDADPALREGLAVLAGEPRARHAYAVPGAAGDLLEAWAGRLGPGADVVARDDAVGRGWFGEVDADLAERIGDVVAVARGDVVLASARTDPVVSGLRGQHGGLTAAEVEVPLLRATG